MYNFFDVYILPYGKSYSQRNFCVGGLSRAFRLHGGKIKHFTGVTNKISYLCNRRRECVTWGKWWASGLSCAEMMPCFHVGFSQVLSYGLQKQQQHIGVLLKCRVNETSTHTLRLCAEIKFSAISKEAN